MNILLSLFSDLVSVRFTGLEGVAGKRLKNVVKVKNKIWGKGIRKIEVGREDEINQWQNGNKQNKRQTKER